MVLAIHRARPPEAASARKPLLPALPAATVQRISRPDSQGFSGQLRRGAARRVHRDGTAIDDRPVCAADPARAAAGHANGHHRVAVRVAGDAALRELALLRVPDAHPADLRGGRAAPVPFPRLGDGRPRVLQPCCRTHLSPLGVPGRVVAGRCRGVVSVSRAVRFLSASLRCCMRRTLPCSARRPPVRGSA